MCWTLDDRAARRVFYFHFIRKPPDGRRIPQCDATSRPFCFLSAAVCFCCCCGLEGIYTRGGAGAELRLMRQNGRRGEDSRHTVTVYMGGQSNTWLTPECFPSLSPSHMHIITRYLLAEKGAQRIIQWQKHQSQRLASLPLLRASSSSRPTDGTTKWTSWLPEPVLSLNFCERLSPHLIVFSFQIPPAGAAEWNE